MDLEINTTPLNIDIYGFGGVAANKDYVGTAFKLMDRMWQIVKSSGLKHKGLNTWVYEPNEKVFAGVELDETPPQNSGLEQKSLTLTKYAYYKHIGPYNLIGQSGLAMRNELKRQGYDIGDTYIEIYGHSTPDGTKSETELIMSLN